MHVPYWIVIEEQEFASYAAVIDERKILILDKAYQRDYDTFDDLGDAKSKGPGPARNFVWDHSIAAGATWHWVMDDNINKFYRLNQNRRIPCGDGTIFRCMEDFCTRYRNIAMAGPGYRFFAPSSQVRPPYILNTRIYSCNLIRNDLPYRWRGRYNEDTDLSLRMLKDSWCTIEFRAFLQEKMATQTVRGGNTDDFYAKEGTMPKSRMLIAMHPDVCQLVWKYNRWHHEVNYRPFRNIKLVLRPGEELPRGFNDYGMQVKQIDKGGKHGHETRKQAKADVSEDDHRERGKSTPEFERAAADRESA